MEGRNVIDVATESVPMAISGARSVHLLTVVLSIIGCSHSPVAPCFLLKKGLLTSMSRFLSTCPAYAPIHLA